MTKRYQIAEWTFTPGSHELLRGGETVKLEHRAALALALLCELRGEIVAQTDLVSTLWGTRQVSANSLPVVIRDLRQALGDDARNPVYIETIAKGGYRLIAADVLPAKPAQITASRGRALAGATLAAGALIVLGGAGALALNWRTDARTLVVVEDMHNETGSKAYDALTKASTSLVVANLSARPQLRVSEANVAAAGTRAIRLKSKLVLWSGQPDVVFVAEDAKSADVLWSGYAFGAENTLPGKVNGKLAEFAETVAAAK